MNVSFQWLRALAPDLATDPSGVADRLTELGFPVEGAVQLARGLENIVVARVDAVRSHPDADRLRVCDVDTGEGRVQVVCGAPNVEAGGLYPLAPVGATLPGGMKIRKAKLRGEVSEGMLCSEIELGLGRGKDGLMVLDLDPDAPSARPGTPLVEALGLDDVRLDVEVTSNRPDLLSHRGLAREVAPAGEGSLVVPTLAGGGGLEGGAPPVLEGSASGVSHPSGGLTVRIEDPDLCPRYLGLVLRGVRVGPSPSWLQARLRAAGARPINNVVDATNYVLLELGQPLHAFDLARISGGEVVVARATKGERLRTLDGEDRSLDPGMLTIRDARGPLAVAGVMGGEASEVTPDTTDLFLECALFTPGPVRATRKALGLSTDASYRFERGVDPEGLRGALLRCAELVLATAGGHVDGPILDVAHERPRSSELSVRLSRVSQVLGVPFDAPTVTALLEPLGFRVSQGGEDGVLAVAVPGWRSWDVRREIDLVEEIARRHGYDRFPDDLRPYRPGSVPDDPLFALEDDLRTLLVGRGFLEAQTPAFAPRAEGAVAVMNPVSAEEGFLRGALLPALLRRVEYNLARGTRDVRLFEIGTVFAPPPAPGELPVERTHLAAVLHGRRAPEHWTGEAGEVDLWEVRGLLDSLAQRAGHGTLRIEGVTDGEAVGPATPYVAGHAFRVVDADGVQVGAGGRVRPERLDLPPWATAAWGIELTLPGVPAPRPVPRAQPLPTHPGVERDLALLVGDDRPVAAVQACAENRGGALLRNVEVFDVYRGTGVPAGMRSVAVRFRFRADGRSLTDAEVDDALQSIRGALEEELDVRVRGG
jgi:phenylalanyl-tRNA synthetase beta chain